MAEFPSYEEIAKKIAEKALDEFLYEGRSIREWVQIITSEDCISRQAVLDMMQMRMSGKELYKAVYDLSPVKPRLKPVHCEDCKHFRKLPYHTDTLGKCVQHTGFCPKGDWYCADYEPQESEVNDEDNN